MSAASRCGGVALEAALSNEQGLSKQVAKLRAKSGLEPIANDINTGIMGVAIEARLGVEDTDTNNKKPCFIQH